MSTPENLRTGERRNVTVLFADMKGFTSLSERMDPEEMDSLMTQVFGTFESIIHRYGGFVEKYIGDALVAVFGVPTLHEDDPARAINASLDFLAEIGRLNQIRPDRAPIAFRIGINTGLITTGRRGEHDVVTGHAMAVAARLESSARTDAVLVSQSTRDRCESDFLFSEEVLVRAQGKEEVVVAFEVRGRNSRPEGDDTVFVGRKNIIDRMLRTFLRHDPSRTEGYIVTGEPGIGKTRLTSEFLKKLRRLPDFSRGILYARARRYGTRPFAVIVDLLTDYFQIDAEMSVERVTDIVEHDLSTERKTAAGFASLVAGTAEEQDNQAFVLLYLILKSIVKKNVDAPYATLLCVDDLHFMDKSSVDFFQFYLRNADTRPFFLFLDRSLDGTFREIFSELEIVELPGLDREETLQLVRAIASEDLDMEMVNSIVENARGNPLFIREYVRYARENRDAQALPSTIQNIFLTSIESYDPTMRDLLKKLSVFAHSFSVEDAEHVHRMTEGDPKAVEAALGFFMREGILTQEGNLFMFRYDLFKKALYTSLLNYNKKILHRIIADLMESKGHPHPIRLLHHLFRSEEFDRAIDSLMSAPNATSNIDYLRYIDRLLEHVGEHDVDRYMRLMFLKSAILFNNGITEEADTLLKGMITLAVDRRSPLYAGSAYHLLTAYNMKAYCFGKARYCGDKALAYYRQAEIGTGHLQNVLEIMTSSELLRNNPVEVDRLVGEIRGLANQDGHHFSSARLSATLAEHHLMRGEYRPAIELLTGVLDEIDPQNESWYSAHLLLGLGYHHVCDWDAARRVDRTVLEGPSRHLSNISQVHARLAVAAHFQDDAREADRRLQQAEFNASQIRNDFDLVDACRTLSTCYLIRGNREKAREFAQRGVTTALRHSATYPVLTVLMVLTECAWAEHDLDAVAFYLLEADQLSGSGVLLPNRDLVLYHYYSARIATDDETREYHRSAGASALRHELEAIGDDRAVERFLQARSFERVHRELLSGADGSGSQTA
ncbi:MAG: adenylate/guanylate cyclase domain-containing protein [Spirochaetota bacterium]